MYSASIVAVGSPKSAASDFINVLLVVAYLALWSAFTFICAWRSASRCVSNPLPIIGFSFSGVALGLTTGLVGFGVVAASVGLVFIDLVFTAFAFTDFVFTDFAAIGSNPSADTLVSALI